MIKCMHRHAPHIRHTGGLSQERCAPCDARQTMAAAAEYSIFPWHEGSLGLASSAYESATVLREQLITFGSKETKERLKRSSSTAPSDDIAGPTSETEPYHSPRVRSQLDKGGALTYEHL